MCPFCHSTKVRRSYPKLWDFLIMIFSGAADALQGLRSSFLLLALEPFRSPTQSFGRAAETHRLSAAAQKIRSGGQALIFKF